MARYFLLQIDDDGSQDIINEYQTEQAARDARNSNLYRMDYDFFILTLENDNLRRIEPPNERFDKAQRQKLTRYIESWLLQKNEEIVCTNMTAKCLLPFARELVHEPPTASLTEIKQRMLIEDVGSVALIQNNECFGIVKRKTLWSFAEKNPPHKKAKLQDVLTPIEEIKIAKTDTDLTQLVEDIHKFTIVLLRENDQLKWALSPKSLASAFEQFSRVYVAVFNLENALKRLVFSLQLSRREIIDFLKNSRENHFVKDDEFIFDKLTQADLKFLLEEHYDKIDTLRPYNKDHLLGELDKAREVRNDLMHFRNLDQLPETLMIIDQLTAQLKV